MPEFKDVNGEFWSVSLDGLILAELREKGIDIVQDGLYLIEQREDVLAKALVIICREQRDTRKLNERHFSKLLIGQVADSAIDAVRGAAELFFRPNRWSEIQRRSNQRREMDEQYQDLRPMLEQLNRPDMPAPMREAVMAAVAAQIEAAISSQSSKNNSSASGQDANQQNAAGDSRDSSVSTQKA